MAAVELNTAGYTRVRQMVRDDWEVQIYDDAGDTVLTLTEADPRVTVGDSHPVLSYTIALSGSDADITFPVVLVGGRLVEGANVYTPNSAFEEGDANIGGEDDEVTVTATFTIPAP